MFNYAKLIADHTVLVFFDTFEIPEELHKYPSLWASWLVTPLPGMHVIGESGGEYCARLSHVPKHPHCECCKRRRAQTCERVNHVSV